MPISPHKDESQSDFMSRCVPEMIGTGDDKRAQEQAVAACYQIWRDKDKNTAAPRRKQDGDIEPEAGESEDDFMDRCMDEIGDEDACQTIWDNSDNSDTEEESASGIQHKTHAGKVSGLEFVMSDETPDRMDDVIMSDGWELE